jgi:hypothetical protein
VAAEPSPDVVSAAQVFLEAEIVVAAEPSPEVVSAVVEPSPEVAAAAELSPEVVFVVVELSAEVVSVAAVFVADVAEPQASVDIAVVFVVLVPFSVVVVEVDSSGRPMFFSLPNICSLPNCSSSVEVVG